MTGKKGLDGPTCIHEVKTLAKIAKYKTVDKMLKKLLNSWNPTT